MDFIILFFKIVLFLIFIFIISFYSSRLYFKFLNFLKIDIFSEKNKSNFITFLYSARDSFLILFYLIILFKFIEFLIKNTFDFYIK